MGTERELNRDRGRGLGKGMVPHYSLSGKVNGVFKVCLAQTVWGFLHQCRQDVGRKELCGEQRRESRLQADEINGQGAKDCGVSHRVLYPLPFSPVPSLSTEKQIYFTPFVLSRERPLSEATFTPGNLHTETKDWVIMICRCRVINGNTCTTLVQDVDGARGCEYWGRRDMSSFRFTAKCSRKYKDFSYTECASHYHFPHHQHSPSKWEVGYNQ